IRPPRKTRPGIRSPAPKFSCRIPRVNSVGRNVERKEGIAKVTGAARYVDDLAFPGMLHGVTIRSTIPFGHIDRVHVDLDPRAFTIVAHRGIPGENVIALIDDDQPCLAAREIRHAEEPIVLLAHADREALIEARRRVRIDTTPREPVFDLRRATRAFKEI